MAGGRTLERTVTWLLTQFSVSLILPSRDVQFISSHKLDGVAHVPLISAIRVQRQGNLCEVEFQPNLLFRVSFRPARTTK